MAVWGAGEVMVFGVVKRNGHVKAMPIAAHDQLEVMREIQAHSREGSPYYTDQWQAYYANPGRTRDDPQGEGSAAWPGPNQRHRRLRELHQELTASVPGVHTKFFHFYLAEACWRLNHRDEDLKPLPKRLPATLSTSDINPILVRKT